jgi:broad specificity phosphatase PhoE
LLRRHLAGHDSTAAPEVRTCFLLRHAVALSRSSWQGEDELRPLSRRGDRQAAALAREFAPEPVARVLASPARRCVGTVAGIALEAGRLVEIAPFLAEGSNGPAALKHLLEITDSSEHPGIVVACTHGDVLVSVIDALVGSEAFDGSPSPIPKGGAVRLDVAAGTIVYVSLLPAPE